MKGISFRGAGEFVGYIGPNGAGKSTTIKMLTGILHPTSGSVSIGGMNPHKERRSVVNNLGVVFGQRSQLWWDLPVKDSYDILAKMYSVDQADKERRLGQFAELLIYGRSGKRLCASCRSGSACAPTSRPRCCMIRTCCSWMSRRSA